MTQQIVPLPPPQIFTSVTVKAKQGFEIHTGCKFKHVEKKNALFRKGRNEADGFTAAGTNIPGSTVFPEMFGSQMLQQSSA